MAKFLAGPMASEIKGSSGGTVFSRNNGGAYIRSRVKGVNPNTTVQRAVRANFGNLAKNWGGTLTQAERDAWTFFGQGNPVVNSLGQSIILSGNAWYNKLNRVLDQIGVAAPSSPPVDLSVPALAAVTGITVDATGGTLQLDTAAQTVVAGAKYYIFATGGVSPGRKPPASSFRFIGAFAAVAAATDVDFYAAWYNSFGNLIMGKKVGVRVSSVNIATGAVTPFLTYAEIAT